MRLERLAIPNTVREINKDATMRRFLTIVGLEIVMRLARDRVGFRPSSGDRIRALGSIVSIISMIQALLLSPNPVNTSVSGFFATHA